VGRRKSERRSALRWSCLLICVATFSAGNANEPEYDLTKDALVTWHDAGTALGRFVLVRSGKAACALRFTEYHSGQDAKPPTTFSSGEESQYAEYEWFYQADGSGNFRAANAESGTGKLSKGPLRGIGRLAFQTGNTTIKCGPLTLGWSYPTRVNFVLPAGELTVQLAPTRWSSIDQVDFHASGIPWYSKDENRQPIVIPLEKLARSSPN
jgi:hypothetical protein